MSASNEPRNVTVFLVDVVSNDDYHARCVWYPSLAEAELSLQRFGEMCEAKGTSPIGGIKEMPVEEAERIVDEFNKYYDE